MFPFCRLPDWRQRPDIIIVAPKVIELRQSIVGFSCQSGEDSIFELGRGGKFKLQNSGILQAFFCS